MDKACAICRKIGHEANNCKDQFAKYLDRDAEPDRSFGLWWNALKSGFANNMRVTAPNPVVFCQRMNAKLGAVVFVPRAHVSESITKQHRFSDIKFVKEARDDKITVSSGQNIATFTTNEWGTKPLKHTEPYVPALFKESESNETLGRDVKDKNDAYAEEPAKPKKDKKPRPRPCYAFRRGKCAKGDACEYSHAMPKARADKPAQPRAVQKREERPESLLYDTPPKVEKMKEVAPVMDGSIDKDAIILDMKRRIEVLEDTVAKAVAKIDELVKQLALRVPDMDKAVADLKIRPEYQDMVVSEATISSYEDGIVTLRLGFGAKPAKEEEPQV